LISNGTFITSNSREFLMLNFMKQLLVLDKFKTKIFNPKMFGLIKPLCLQFFLYSFRPMIAKVNNKIIIENSSKFDSMCEVDGVLEIDRQPRQQR